MSFLNSIIFDQEGIDLPDDVFAKKISYLFREKYIFKSLSEKDLDEVISYLTIESGILMAQPSMEKKIKYNLIDSSYLAFKEIFKSATVENSTCYMFWDNLCSIIQTSTALEESEKIEINEYLLDTLAKSILLENVACQLSAIHGFNHIPHPKSVSILRKVIQSSPFEEVRKAAKMAITFKVM